MFKKFVNICAIIVLLFPSFIMPGRMTIKAETLGDVERELEKYKADYQANKDSQTATEEEINNAQKQIKQANLQIIEANNNIITLREEIDKLNEDISKKDKEIKEIINFFQKSNGESAYLEYAFGAKDFTDFIYRVAVSEQLTNYNKKLITEFKEQIEQNNKKTIELDKKKKELNKKQEDLSELLLSLNSKLATYEEEAIDIEEEIRMKEDAIKMYKDMGCESDDEIDVCTAEKLPTTTKFFRPLKVGYVSQEFGYPDSITQQFYSFHGGIDITTNDNNTPVYASGRGMVVAISRNQRCGKNIVYIQHQFQNGDTYTTSYWHLRRVLVSEGDTVDENTQIGIMGGALSDHDACALGPHVHFVVATGLYLKDYYYLSTFNARRINPRTLVNFPVKWRDFTDRYIKY